MSLPAYTPAEARSRETFLALMWALSYPGRVYNLPDADTNFAFIAEALLYLETSFFTPDHNMAAVLAQTGARHAPVAEAAYHFYPSVGDRELGEIRQASPGTMLYPDTAATLIIGCTIGRGSTITLRGPGVNSVQSITVSGFPDAFWALRDSACRYPLGWDVYFVDGSQVIGLPRSIAVEH